MDDTDNRQADAVRTLVYRCLELPYRERLNLCQALRDSIIMEKKERRNPNANRGQILLDCMGEILGEPVPVKSRESRFVWARAMVAYQLTEEGITTNEAGRMMGKDHTTIMYLRNRMKDALAFPSMYQDIMPIWEQFKNKIEHDIHRRTTQDTIRMGAELPHGGICGMGEESGEDSPSCNL